MNKIIPFNKDITFDDKIGEIESIALDDTLKFIDEHMIKGELIVRGCHKYLDTEKEFSYPIPVEIAVDDQYDTKNATINIDDFYYEIINENLLRVKIDLLLDNLFYVEKKDVREEKVEVLNEGESEEKEESVLDLFKQNDNKKDYSVYCVYIFNENDTINSILDKYHVTKEDLAELNDLENLQVGSKLIIPSVDE